jgi:8-oxo-dGTP diphosphatase
MKNYVVGFMFSKDEQFTLLIRKNHPEWQAGKLNGIGGKMEEGEWPRATMVREFREETELETVEADWEIAGRIEGLEYRVFILRAHSNALWNFKSPTDEKVMAYCTDPVPHDTVPNLKVIIPALLLREEPGIYLDYTHSR